MDHKSTFESLWTDRFPDAKPPELPCFCKGFESEDDQKFCGMVQNCLTSSRKRLDDLQAQAQREVFIIDYLEDLNNSLNAGQPELGNGVASIGLPGNRPSVKVRVKEFQQEPQRSPNSHKDFDISIPSPGLPKVQASGKRAPPPPPRWSTISSSPSLDEDGRELGSQAVVKTPPPVMEKPKKRPTISRETKINEEHPPSYYCEINNTETKTEQSDAPAMSSFSCRKREPRQNQYEEVEVPSEKAPEEEHIPHKPQLNAYEEVDIRPDSGVSALVPRVGIGFGLTNINNAEYSHIVKPQVVPPELTGDEVMLYSDVDKSKKVSKPKPVDSKDPESASLYEDIPVPPKSEGLIAEFSKSSVSDSSFDQTGTPVSSEEDEDKEVLYANIQMLRKQRRLTQTVQHLLQEEKRKTSIADGTEHLSPIVDDDDQINSIDLDIDVPVEEVFPAEGGAAVAQVGQTDACDVNGRVPVSIPDDNLDNISCSESLDSFQLDLAGSPVQSPEEKNEKLRMRKWVVTGILDSEHDYVITLRVLTEIRHGLEAAALSKTTSPVIDLEDVHTIFYKIPDLHRSHSNFVAQLEPVVENWSADAQIGTIFKEQAVYLTENVEYVKNYQKACATFKKCCQESEQFRDMVQGIRLRPNDRESYTLEELLHKPVVRFQRGTLVLHDLLKSTPIGHPDHMWLQKAQKLTQYSLDALGTDIISGQENAENHLVRTSLIVEQIGHSRKLRHVLLFNNVFVCAKQRSGRQQNKLFEVKWHIPLTDLFIIDTQENDSPHDKKRDKSQQEVDSLRDKVKSMKSELRREYNREQKPGSLRKRNQSLSSKMSNRTIEKLKKRITESETSLVLAEPRLSFKLMNRKIPDKQFKFLLCSDFERNEWRDVINTMKAKALPGHKQGDSEVQQMIDNCKQLTKLSTLGEDAAIRQAMNQESMNGFLNVTVHKLDGLDTPCDMYTCIEVDSYGHFYMKAKTNVVCNSTNPEWNQDFEIDLDASNTVRIMCYKQTSTQDVLMGKSALELSPAWLKESFQEKIISVNELSLTLSIRYTPREKTLRKSMCRQKIRRGIFGIKISAVTKQEGTDIPCIITGCVEEVERRGLDEVGIYRVSGVTSEVQTLRSEFEKQSRNAVNILKNYDINAVTGVFKMYLRELPEALFTDSLYPNFADAYELVDPDGRRNCMISLLQSLPEPNFSTIMYILNHLLRVSILESENKMSPQNLATIFGPTLLRPAQQSKEGMSLEYLLTMETKDAMTQSGILLFFLTLLKNGVSFSRQEEKVTQF